MNDINELLQEAKDTVGPGWWPIIDKYLPQMVEEYSEIKDYDVKEKYGTLHIVIYGTVLGQDKTLELAREVERASAKVCQECGSPRKLRWERGWIGTLCDNCATAKKNNQNFIKLL